MIQRDVEALIVEDVIELSDLVIFLDGYYKIQAFQPKHYNAIAKHILDKKYSVNDFGMLKLNEALRFFRGITLGD
jgi:hypothetical protein